MSTYVYEVKLEAVLVASTPRQIRLVRFLRRLGQQGIRAKRRCAVLTLRDAKSIGTRKRSPPSSSRPRRAARPIEQTLPWRSIRAIPIGCIALPCADYALRLAP